MVLNVGGLDSTIDSELFREGKISKVPSGVKVFAGFKRIEFLNSNNDYDKAVMEYILSNKNKLIDFNDITNPVTDISAIKPETTYATMIAPTGNPISLSNILNKKIDIGEDHLLESQGFLPHMDEPGTGLVTLTRGGDSQLTGKEFRRNFKAAKQKFTNGLSPEEEKYFGGKENMIAMEPTDFLKAHAKYLKDSLDKVYKNIDGVFRGKDPETGKTKEYLQYGKVLDLSWFNDQSISATHGYLYALDISNTAIGPEKGSWLYYRDDSSFGSWITIRKKSGENLKEKVIKSLEHQIALDGEDETLKASGKGDSSKLNKFVYEDKRFVYIHMTGKKSKKGVSSIYNVPLFQLVPGSEQENVVWIRPGGSYPDKNDNVPKEVMDKHPDLPTLPKPILEVSNY